MRRSLLNTRLGRSPIQLFLNQPRRTYATPPSQSETPPAPIEPSNQQSIPIGPYYESVLNNPQPIPEKKPEGPPVTSTTTDKEAPSTTPQKEESQTPQARRRKSKTPKDDSAKAATPPPTPTPSAADGDKSPQAQARIIFGSRLLGPAERAERLEAIRKRSQLIAGVLVPPKPEEPDNCCMSGCVNCVWDRYRDELEAWAAANREAERRLRAQEAGVAATADSMAATKGDVRVGRRELDRGAVSMDDDGGGSVGNWDVGNIAGQGAGGRISLDFWDDELYKNVPVGIREFMKQEKRLKEKHMREGTFGG
ncbi:hypothetical protein VTK73DRAFT_3551 [Phialemonium thermophilum]|uniref:Oxidoreductase-like domain-containing protein n=1 Tax=Phialemonium thermophilum TaxID=223376 RepID=A0ABR3Y0F9_9PEZI